MNTKNLTSTYNFLRDAIAPWKQESKKAGGNKCSLTSTKSGVQVHHLKKSFIDIAEETFTELEIEYFSDIRKYTPEQLEMIQRKCIELHFKYGLGVLVCERLHRRFHMEYGVTGYTEDNFRNFKKDLRKQQVQSRKNNKAK